ncbi:MAG: tyrosine--tRNA ligase [Pseudomonadota bacterium]|nr:tyrosine--tRNA ligase [Pseudomonadota bacterium]
MHDKLSIISRGTDEIIEEEGLIKKLEASRPLTIKAGFDPTAPDIHLGHTVLLNKMRQFQDLGHKVIFLIGDFTATIGDPTGKTELRPILSEKEILENAKTYKEQVFKILNPKETIIKFNSEWLKKLSGSKIIEIIGEYSVARMLERDDFKKRFKNNQNISIKEFVYPILQGYDSYAINADVELGGTDQKFNLLMGRHIQALKNPNDDQAKQIVITLPLLEGTDGVKKMSKSLDNYIGINDKSDDMFGKIMSISDDLMWKYYDLLSFKKITEIEKFKKGAKNNEINPRDIKLDLASEIVERFHSEKEAIEARKNFLDVFQKNMQPDPSTLKTVEIKKMPLPNLLKESGLVSSTSEARRLISQGALKIDNVSVESAEHIIEPGEYFLKLGKKKFINIKVIS